MTEIKKGLKIALSQLNFTVGNFVYNKNKILNSYIKLSQESDIVVFAELALSSYNPEDWLYNEHFYNKQNECLEELFKASKTCDSALIIGAFHKEENTLYNSLFFIEKGEIKLIYHKQTLPSKGVFNEPRWFKSGQDIKIYDYKGYKLGFLICEDIWHDETSVKLNSLDMEVLLVINASPFSYNKHQKRIKLLSKICQNSSATGVYVNHISGHDELIFDGASFVVNKQGDLVSQLKFFAEDKQIISIDEKNDINSINKIHQMSNIEMCYQAILLGIKDYLFKTGFNEVVIGLSGGIDSALVCCLAVDALGADKVYPYFLPTSISSQQSYEDALELANNLKLTLNLIDIEPIFDTTKSSLKQIFIGKSEDITEENMQSRIRGLLLMSISNKFNRLLLACSNKSEIATGYATLYGDMCGAYAPLKDVYKTDLYKLVKWRNYNLPSYHNNWGSLGIFSDSIINKAPSAELKPNQRDSDILPEYDDLDNILPYFIERNMSEEEIISSGFSADLVTRVSNLLRKSEYKRKQAAPGPKISSRHFGKDWQYPITCHFK